MMRMTRFLMVLGAATIAIASTCDDNPTQPGDSLAQCGTIQGLACPSGETCELPAGQCQVSDLGGLCVRTPEACTEEYNPVCGCDGVTYSNDCVRLAAGAQKSHDGECS